MIRILQLPLPGDWPDFNYRYDAIPQEWLSLLVGKEIIEDCVQGMERYCVEHRLMPEPPPHTLDDIHALGEGWCGDEALAIAVFCAVKYQDDFDKALLAAVNHGGDSDSTGAITGNLLGAFWDCPRSRRSI